MKCTVVWSHWLNVWLQVAFSQKAPRGYTFIPAGDPQITNRCKEIAREDGEKVFIVTVCIGLMLLLHH